MKGRRLAALLVAALALVAAGCGGGGSDEASDQDTVAVETTTDTATTADSSTTDDMATDTTSDADIGALSGKCAELVNLGSSLAAAMGGQNADVADVSKLFDELADKVPDEIKADWQVLAENFEKIAEALQGVDLQSGGTPDADTLAKLQELSTKLDTQEVQQAAAHIEAWATKNC